jgi:glycosyltransferase involved in cell wall biosynthesis
LWIGRLEAPKRPDIFVEAIARAARSRPLRGLVLGDGSLRESSEQLARQLDAPVEFLGERSEVTQLLTGAWATCLFSDFEGVPFAVQEAMWSGRAVVVSDLPSLRWFAKQHAHFVKDAASAASALQELCDPVTARTWGERAAAQIRTLVAPDAPFPQLLSDYGYTPDGSEACPP